MYNLHTIKSTHFNKCGIGCGGKRTLVYYWWECEMVQPLWKTVWRFLKKLKTITILSSNCSTGYLPREYRNTNSERYLHPYIHSSIIYNSQKMETIQMSINWWIGKQMMVYTHNGILFSHKKELGTGAPGWLSWESIWLLTAGLWIQALHWV